MKENPHIARIAAALAPDEVRCIGGAVRDMLLGIQSQDIDLATTARPETTVARLDKAGIVNKPTGIEFGTVTAILERKPYEITSLREDMECDGRHAVVSYTNDWQKDASRRDFTINAMSMDMSGTVHDYFGGRADLEKGILRFVGNAAERIREDYLRILRLFRFHAWYGKTPLDEETLAACREGREGILKLSAERIQKEMLKLLSAPAPYEALKAMQDCGVLAAVLPSQAISALPRIKTLEQLEKTHAEIPAKLAGPFYLRRLALLLSQHFLETAAGWKLSRAAADGLKKRAEFTQQFSDEALLPLIRRYGKEVALDGLLILAANGKDISGLLPQMLAFEIPVFPLKGEDVIARFPKLVGKEIGDYLARAEAAWEESGYALSKENLLKLLG